MHRTTWGLTAALAVLLAGCGGGGSGGDAAPNSSPVAHAGANQTVLELSDVTLSGTGSSDADGSIQAYQWTQQGGPAVVLSNADAAAATFAAPDVAGSEDLTFELTVTDDDGAAASASVTVTVVENLTTTVSGKVTFDYVPVASSPVRLDYLGTVARPARGVTVQLMDGANVADTAVTDQNGDYSLIAAGGTNVFVRVRAEMVQSAPDWDVRVVDNTQGNALYVMDGTPFNASAAAVTANLHADSGWTDTGYGEPRVAAPFAVLDIVHDAMQLVLGTDPAASCPPLVMHWSPGNTDTFGADGQPDPATGEIGTSFYISGGGTIPGGIYLLGDENNDTDEYDRHVIAHEWGHYFENNFSRSDSIGGPHTQGDQLDMRVAFGEGFGNALSGMITGDAVYKDTSSVLQGSGFSFSVESTSTSTPGWYNEFSVQQILYDLYDPMGEDPVELGFGPLYAVLVDEQRLTPALTSIFPFINALKAREQDQAAGIDAVAAAQGIAAVMDAYGSTETNSGSPANPDVLPIYVPLTVNGAAENVCSTCTDDVCQGHAVNKLGSRRYLTFTADTPGTYTLTATTTDAPAGTTPDPDMWLHRMGFVGSSESSPGGTTCGPADLASCVETATAPLIPGDYVLEVYEWTNTNDNDDENPPIGRTCFDVEVTGP